mmetsp:Transcript_38990/g.59287  ORF Transcript_38990/g.59287 Transcript_38990/m.59287 type:complete len:159 (+) Transcript_38990:3474-3950(+)
MEESSDKKAVKNMVFANVEKASHRLILFNNFCSTFKPILNKLVKKIYNSRSSEKESLSREMAPVTEYIKYMPTLLDFDNKRLFFKKEIKKMRKTGYHRTLTLNIRRNEIFMDAYSHLSHLTAAELKQKIQIEFTGERGQDIGGLTRDFFIELSKEMLN